MKNIFFIVKNSNDKYFPFELGEIYSQWIICFSNNYQWLNVMIFSWLEVWFLSLQPPCQFSWGSSCGNLCQQSHLHFFTLSPRRRTNWSSARCPQSHFALTTMSILSSFNANWRNMIAKRTCEDGHMAIWRDKIDAKSYLDSHLRSLCIHSVIHIVSSNLLK